MFRIVIFIMGCILWLHSTQGLFKICAPDTYETKYLFGKRTLKRIIKNKTKHLRIHFLDLLRTFCPHFGSFCVVSSSIRFGQILPLAFFRWLTPPSDWNAESNLDHPSRPVAQRIEALSLYGSRWALLEDSGFNSYPSRPEVYLVKNVVRSTTTMEGSNYWGYGYNAQHSFPRSRSITWRGPEVKFGRNLVKKKQYKNYQDEDKKSAINKKLILELRSLNSKWF